MKIKNIFYLLLIFMVCGCATWVAVGGNYKANSQNYQVELPEGWRKYNPATGKLLITKDGFSLQHIQILRREIGTELPYTKKKLSKGMLPQEAAELVMDNIRSNPNILNQNFIENRPAQIGGHAGFKIVYTYQNKNGLNKKGALYCLLVGDWCYEIIYEAPERHYFSKDLPAFEKIKESFRLIRDTVPQTA
jgi:hypothetical protein